MTLRYTDGLTEARVDGERVGPAWLGQRFADPVREGHSPASTVARLLEHVGPCGAPTTT
jgi:hypothetical protein